VSELSSNRNLTITKSNNFIHEEEIYHDETIISLVEEEYLLNPQVLSYFDLNNSEIPDLQLLMVDSLSDQNSLIKNQTISKSQKLYFLLTSKVYKISSLFFIEYENTQITTLQSVTENCGFGANLCTLAVYQVKQSEYFFQITSERLIFFNLASSLMIYEYSWRELIQMMIQRNPSSVNALPIHSRFLTDLNSLKEVHSCFYPAGNATIAPNKSSSAFSSNRFVITFQNYLISLHFDLSSVMKRENFFTKLEVQEFPNDIYSFSACVSESKILSATVLWDSSVVHFNLNTGSSDPEKNTLVLSLEDPLTVKGKKIITAFKIIPLYSCKYYHQISSLNYFVITVLNGNQLFFYELLCGKESTALVSTRFRESRLPTFVDHIIDISDYDTASNNINLSFILCGRNEWYFLSFASLSGFNVSLKNEDFKGMETVFRISAFQKVCVSDGFTGQITKYFNEFDIINSFPMVVNSHQKTRTIKSVYWMQHVCAVSRSDPAKTEKDMFMRLFFSQDYHSKYRLFSCSIENPSPVTATSNEELSLYSRYFCQKQVFLSKKVVSVLFLPHRSLLLLLSLNENLQNTVCELSVIDCTKVNQFRFLFSMPVNQDMCHLLSQDYLETIESWQIIAAPAHDLFFQNSEQNLVSNLQNREETYFHLVCVSSSSENPVGNVFNLFSFRLTLSKEKRNFLFTANLDGNELSLHERKSLISFLSYYPRELSIIQEDSVQQRLQIRTRVQKIPIENSYSELHYLDYQLKGNYLLVTFLAGEILVLGWKSKVISQVNQANPISRKTLITLECLNEFKLDLTRNSQKVILLFPF
jgi:hypothetical protein